MESLTNALCSIFKCPILLPFSDPPSKTFGLFITLTRTQTIKEWPHDIHGCLGYWNSDYQTIGIKTIKNKIIQLAYDTAFNDDRHKYFPPLNLDVNTELKISYMLLPVSEIKNNLDTIIDSKTGIIYDNGRNRATYLPDVFKNITYREIMKSVKNKAHATNGNDIFYTYNTIEISNTLYNCLFNKSYLETLINKYVNYMSKFDKVPYSISNGKVYYDNKQDVRNLSVISTLMELNTEKFSSWYEPYIAKDVSRQALTSVYEITNANDVADYLWSEHENMEPVFEMPQTFLSLAVSKYGSQIKQKVITMMDNFELRGLDDIFKANWWAQVIVKYNIFQYKDKFINYFNNIYPDVLNSETNYLAVFFEGVSALHNDKLNTALFNVFIELLHRYNTETGMFEFKDSTMRIDITNHVINGILFHY